MSTFAQLPPKMRAVADLYLRGLTAPQIARKLGVSVNTVGTQRRRLFLKLDVADRGALAARWLKEHVA